MTIDQITGRHDIIIEKGELQKKLDATYNKALDDVVAAAQDWPFVRNWGLIDKILEMKK